MPEPLPEGSERLREEPERGEAILWWPDRDGLRPLKVRTGLVGEEETEVRGEGTEEGLKVASVAESPGPPAHVLGTPARASRAADAGYLRSEVGWRVSTSGPRASSIGMR